MNMMRNDSNNSPNTDNKSTKRLYRAGGLQPIHYFILLGGIVLFVLILSADRTALQSNRTTTAAANQNTTNNNSNNNNNNTDQSKNSTAASVKGIGGLPPLNISSSESQIIDKLTQELAAAPNAQASAEILNRLVAALVGAGRPDYAAYYQEQLLGIDSSLAVRQKAAALLADAVEMPALQADSVLLKKITAKAIAAYQDYTARAPSDTSAAVRLAVLYVRSGDPSIVMNGIRQLRSIVEKQPLHFEANLQLGIFSITTRQFDKAVSRLEQALKVQPQHALTWFYLGQAKLGLEEKKAARTAFENARRYTQDPVLTNEINQLLKSL
jgi:tetratricopeptide (TPR) repeat protein